MSNMSPVLAQPRPSAAAELPARHRAAEGEMGGRRKRKASDDVDMGGSPEGDSRRRSVSRASLDAATLALASRAKHARRNAREKRGYPLPRRLGLMDAAALRQLVMDLAGADARIASFVDERVPTPTVRDSLQHVQNMARAFHAELPLGVPADSRYAWSRVHAAYSAMLDAIGESVDAHTYAEDGVTPAQLETQLWLLLELAQVLDSLPQWAEVPRAMQQLRLARDEVLEACMRVLERAEAGRLVSASWLSRLGNKFQADDHWLAPVVTIVRAMVGWHDDESLRRSWDSNVHGTGFGFGL